MILSERLCIQVKLGLPLQVLNSSLRGPKFRSPWKHTTAYHNAAQRKKVLRGDLQQLLDEHLDTEGSVAFIRGIIREELNTKFDTLKKDLTKTIDNKVKTLTDENQKLMRENTMIKKVVSEQQKCLERLQRNDSKNNIFISGIPNKVNTDMETVPDDNTAEDVVDSPEEIIHHILTFLHPAITNDCYKIVKNFDAREGYTRHSAKITVAAQETKAKIFKSCSKFKDLPRVQ